MENANETIETKTRDEQDADVQEREDREQEYYDFYDLVYETYYKFLGNGWVSHDYELYRAMAKFLSFDSSGEPIRDSNGLVLPSIYPEEIEDVLSSHEYN